MNAGWALSREGSDSLGVESDVVVVYVVVCLGARAPGPKAEGEIAEALDEVGAWNLGGLGGRCGGCLLYTSRCV